MRWLGQREKKQSWPSDHAGVSTMPCMEKRGEAFLLEPRITTILFVDVVMLEASR